MYIKLLSEMFEEMTIKKNTAVIPTYYHPDFLLYTNGQKMDYQTYLVKHEKFYDTPIQYRVEYDDETFFERDNKIAGRLWITITTPGSAPKKIEVILIVEFKENKIYRLWELTYPDWSQMESFKDK